jgi:hypothetical protein
MATTREVLVKGDSPGDTRRKVLWLGSPPDAAVAAEFEKRQLILDRCNDSTVASEFRVSTAMVLRFDEADPKLFTSRLNSVVVPAFNHGLHITAWADNDGAFLAMNELLKNGPCSAEIIKKVKPAPHEVTELIARHDPGAGEADVEITGERVPDETRLLLRRAFSDCVSLKICSLSGGRSANVFSVHAHFRDSRVGPRPLPFFAKVDKRNKILHEWHNYQNIVGHFIPFHSRPNLEPNRCLVGALQGILVGNFVEQSESLWEVAKRGSAQPVIYSLFDEALRGWRLQAYVQDESFVFRTKMLDFSPFRLDPNDNRLISRAGDATRFGSVRSWPQIIELLRKNEKLRHRVAPSHGDLHVNNVRARHGEAILIDFNSTQYSAPLVADPASLEVSVVFEVDPNDQDNEGWLATVKRLYEPEYLYRAPPPPDEPSTHEWMWACVRQIRLIALESQTSDTEYQFALILYLLRRASFADESAPDKFRRDFAYYLANQLVESLEAMKPKNGG